MEFKELTEPLQQIFDTVLIPALLAGVAYLIALIRKYAKEYADQMAVKHELENMAKKTEIKNTLLKEIQTIVDSVVGSNMQLADAMKQENGGALTQEQSDSIKNSAEITIRASLPESLTEPDGILSKVIGGSDRLHIIIGNMIDKAVYEYKLKKTNK